MLPFLGKASPSFTSESRVGVPPSLSITSTETVCEAGIAPIVAKVLVIIIGSDTALISLPNSSNTFTEKRF